MAWRLDPGPENGEPRLLNPEKEDSTLCRDGWDLDTLCRPVTRPVFCVDTEIHPSLLVFLRGPKPCRSGVRTRTPCSRAVVLEESTGRSVSSGCLMGQRERTSISPGFVTEQTDSHKCAVGVLANKVTNRLRLRRLPQGRARSDGEYVLSPETVVVLSTPVRVPGLSRAAPRPTSGSGVVGTRGVCVSRKSGPGDPPWGPRRALGRSRTWNPTGADGLLLYVGRVPTPGVGGRGAPGSGSVWEGPGES